MRNFLVKDKSVSTYHRNIQAFYIEIYIFTNEMSPETANEILQLREINDYNLTHPLLFIVPPVQSVFNGTECATYRGPLIDNKKFQKIVKPIFGNKIKGKSQVTLVRVKELVTEDKTLGKTFKTFFV